MTVSLQQNTFFNNTKEEILYKFAPKELYDLTISQSAIPELAKNTHLLNQIESALIKLPTYHHFHLHDATNMHFLKPESVHLIVTSPPYWTLKKYKIGRAHV